MEYFTVIVYCPFGHEIEIAGDFGDQREIVKRVLCPECTRKFEIWLKLESRPVVVRNSDPQWVENP